LILTGCCLLVLVSHAQSQGLWRPDGRCGPRYRLSDGQTPGQCDPQGDGPKQGPCCSSRGFCGNTVKHCKCPGCKDFSQVPSPRPSTIGASIANRRPVSAPQLQETQRSEVAVAEPGPEHEPFGGSWGEWWNGWMRRVEEYLPTNVTHFLTETAKEGINVLSEIYNETRHEAIQKSSIRVDEFTNILERFIDRLEALYQTAAGVVEQNNPLSDTEILARKAAANLDGTKEELDRLQAELPREREENQQYEGLEGYLQRMITTARELLSTADSQADLAWSKLKQLELEFYQASEVLASTSGEIRQQLNKAFREMERELEEASPALKRFLDTVAPK